MDLDKQALDRYITGNWGEDSVPDDDPTPDYPTAVYALGDRVKRNEKEGSVVGYHGEGAGVIVRWDDDTVERVEADEVIATGETANRCENCGYVLSIMRDDQFCSAECEQEYTIERMSD